jgi:hypothetical protein
VLDFWEEQRFGPFVSDTDRLPRNVLQYFTDGLIVTVRPSGTEPKLKLYCQLLPTGEPPGLYGFELFREARARVTEAARLVYNELLGRVDLSLGEAALCLPDLVDFDGKREFERTTAPALHEKLATSAFPDFQALLEWLRQQTASMTAGADPLPALKDAMACLVEQWSGELGAHALLNDLARWAKR